MQLTANSATATETESQQAARAHTGKQVNVLAVDDNDDFRAIIVEMLAPLGFEVQTAASPVKALELFQREKDKYNLVLLDYYMPQLDGAKTFEWMRKLNPNVKVIICSGADELRLRQLQAQYKIDGYLHKPFRIPEALQMIQRVMGMPVQPVG
jgi:two-component system, cell cycle sensor histidine kinase and response regulator CckA